MSIKLNDLLIWLILNGTLLRWKVVLKVNLKSSITNAKHTSESKNVLSLIVFGSENYN